MSLVEEALRAHPPAGLTLRDRAAMGLTEAKQAVLELLDRKPVAGLSARQWADLGLESAEKTVKEVEELVGQ